jgi:hypothetical protein
MEITRGIRRIGIGTIRPSGAAVRDVVKPA